MSEMDVAYALKSRELAIDARDKAIKELQAQLSTTREHLLEMKAANRELRSLNVKPGISLGYVSELREIAGDLAAALWIQHGPGIDCMWCNRYNDQRDNPCKAKAALAKAKAAGISPLAKSDRS